jgi:hypothetical protein
MGFASCYKVSPLSSHLIREYFSSTMNSVDYSLDYEKIDQVLNAIQSLDYIMLSNHNSALAVFCYTEASVCTGINMIGDPVKFGRAQYVILKGEHIKTQWKGLTMESTSEINSEQCHLESHTLRLIFPPIKETTSTSALEKALLTHDVRFNKKTVQSHDSKITHTVHQTLQKLLEYGHWRLDCINEWLEGLLELESEKEQWFELLMDILSETALFDWKMYQFLKQSIVSEELERLRHRFIVLSGQWLCTCDRFGTWTIPQSTIAMRHTISAMEFCYKIIGGNYLNQLSDAEFKQLSACVGKCSHRLKIAFDLHGCRYRIYERAFGKETKQMARGIVFERPSTKDLSEFGRDWINLIVRTSQRLQKSLDDLDSKMERKDQKGKVLEITSEKEKALSQLASSSLPVNFKWYLGRFIGAGSFGTVYMAFNEETGDVMAVKEIQYRQAKSFQVLQELLLDEIHIFQSLRHLHVVTYYGIEVYRDKLYLLMEYCPASLTKLIKDREVVSSLKMLRAIMKQMLQGLHYLHSHSIVHR